MTSPGLVWTLYLIEQFSANDGDWRLDSSGCVQQPISYPGLCVAMVKLPEVMLIKSLISRSQMRDTSPPCPLFMAWCLNTSLPHMGVRTEEIAASSDKLLFIM
jgi:hypothetical protein